MAQRRRGRLPYVTRHGAGWRGWWMTAAGARQRGPTRTTELEAYHDALRERQRAPRTAAGLTIGGAIALTEAELVKLRRREGTMDWFRDKARTVLSSWAADTELDKLDAAELQAWFDARTARGWSASTARHFSRFLSRVFRVAIKNGWGGVNPLARVTLPTAGHAAPDVFGWQEALDLVQRVRHSARVGGVPLANHGVAQISAAQRDADLLELVLRTGLRRSEVARLRLEDFDARTRQLQVRGKTGRRVLPLSEQAAECVGRVIEIPRYPVAVGTLGNPQLTPDRISKVFARWARRLREPRLHPHAFRHTLATELVRRGTPLPTVARLLGHAGLGMVLRYYSASEPALREAVEGL